jgi:MMP 1-O-methyltransferase
MAVTLRDVARPPRPVQHRIARGRTTMSEAPANRAGALPALDAFRRIRLLNACHDILAAWIGVRPTGQGGVSETFDHFVRLSENVPGWTRGEEARELMQMSASLPDDSVLVEIGSFFGSGTILLAGARQIRGSGLVHCVDPFDASGDPHSIPYYQDIIIGAGGRTLREYFETNLRNAGLEARVQVHQGRADQIARDWTTPVDMLFFDADQTYEGVRLAYDSWAPFLKRGGILAMHNSRHDYIAPGHDGHRIVVAESVMPPAYSQIRLIGTTTFAVKT